MWKLSTQALVKRLKGINTSRAVAMAVVVNSPGGLPVQSQIISDKLRQFSTKHNLKMYTFAQDLAASGGYMVLCSGDHVVADLQDGWSLGKGDDPEYYNCKLGHFL